jgi:hypothetical protein
MQKLINYTEEHRAYLYNMSLSQYKNLNKLRIHNDYNVFKFNIDEKTIVLDKNSTKSGTINIKFELGCIYIFALNERNAIRKVNTILNLISKQIKASG